MEMIITGTSGGLPGRLRVDVELFCRIDPDDEAKDGDIRMKVFRTAYELSLMEQLTIIEFVGRREFHILKSPYHFDFMEKEVAIDRASENTSFVAVEQLRGGIWILQKIIPARNILRMETELVTPNDENFSLIIAVPSLYGIKIPNYIFLSQLDSTI